MKTYALQLVCLCLLGSYAEAQGSGGTANTRTADLHNPGWGTGAASCSCLIDPKHITAPGDNTHIVFSNLTSEAVKWGPNPAGEPIAGVTLGYYGPTAVKLGKVPLALPVPSSAFIGDITDYLEEWTAGDCPVTPGGCPVEMPCWFRISYTIDSTGSQYDGPVEWTATSTGGVSETGTLDPSDPNQRQVDINMYCSPPCDPTRGSECKVTQDMGACTQTRSFQTLDISCTKCD